MLEGVDDGAGDSPGGGPLYVVVGDHARTVVDAHGGCKVFVVTKSGSKLNVLVACNA